jgi:lipid-A-disaccharide synthase
MKYYIIAGEASGDLHASNLMAGLNALDQDAHFRCWGGDKMQASGGVIVKHIRELAFMGFAEVLINLPTIFRNLAFCKKDIVAYKPDALILVDYPGFNLRIARFAKEQGIPVFYYISPQIWAWKQSRVKQIRQDVDTMMVILPFEKEFYARFGMDVHFVGHPLLDVIGRSDHPSGIEHVIEPLQRAHFFQANELPDKELVAILPGSRKQEIERMLALMTQVAGDYPDYHFVIAGMSGHAEQLYNRFGMQPNISIMYDQTYALLSHARAAMVTSGTATLETALFGVPQVVCYTSSKLSYQIAKRLIKVKYISLVNLIMDQPLIRELIQYGFNRENLSSELGCLLSDADYRKKIIMGYSELQHKLGGPGASHRAAKIIRDRLQNFQ